MTFRSHDRYIGLFDNTKNKQMKNILYLLLVTVFSLQVNNVFAQGCEGDDPAAGTDSLSAYKPVVFGYIQSQYDYSLGDENENSFKFKRARVGVRGKVKGNFSYYFMLEASPFISGGDAYLMDAFVTYDAGNWARISAGSFKQPFSLEVATPCHSLTTIDRSIVADQLVAPQRDFGVAVFGGNKFTKLNYAVALMNGSGLRVKDNNKKKDIIGRATYKVTDFLTVGGSFRYGFPAKDEDTPTDPRENDHVRQTYGGEFLLNVNNLHVQGEYIYDEGDDNPAAGGGCGAEPLPLGWIRTGGYVMASYDTKWNIQPVLKYEYFDPNIDVNDIGYMEMMTIGANYFFNDKVRLQLNYQAHIETINAVDNDMLLAQLQIKF